MITITELRKSGVNIRSKDFIDGIRFASKDMTEAQKYEVMARLIVGWAKGEKRA